MDTMDKIFGAAFIAYIFFMWFGQIFFYDFAINAAAIFFACLWAFVIIGNMIIKKQKRREKG